MSWMNYAKRAALLLAYVLPFIGIEAFARAVFDIEMDATTMIAVTALYMTIGAKAA